ncbi:hypothetical protein ACTL6U_02770 [Rhodovibrionaceae bacterium A322]
MKRLLIGIAWMAGAALAAGSALADPVTVKVTKKDCQRLVKYTPDASVSADYQPGVSTTGKKVASADLNGGATIQPPEVYTFNLNFSVLPGRYNNSDINLGQVKVTKDGRVYWNGEPLQSDDSHALSQKCQEILRRN